MWLKAMHLFETRPGQQEGLTGQTWKPLNGGVGQETQDWMTPAAFGEVRGKKRIRSCWGGGGRFLPQRGGDREDWRQDLLTALIGTGDWGVEIQ